MFLLLPVKGFYYDAYYNDLTLNETHFGIIDAQAQKAVAVCSYFELILKFVFTLFCGRYLAVLLFDLFDINLS
jgi:hypothetical protein